MKRPREFKTSFRTILLVILVPMFLGFTGCASSQQATAVAPEMKGNYHPPGRSQYLNDMAAKVAPLHKVDPEADYVLGPEDLLEVDVFQADDFKRTVRVSGQGFITMPLIGQVKTRGLTTAQLEKELNRQLAKYLQDPQVNVYIKEYKSQRVGVMGAVAHPQIYNVTGQKYLVEMLFMAGMLKDAGSVCYVFRPAQGEKGSAGAMETIVIDLIELLEKGNRSLNIPIFGGDVINVPRAGVVYVDGAVKRPGMFNMSSGTTVIQAIAMAGGFKFEADKTGIQILRQTGNGERQIIVADYQTAKTDERYMLKDNDIILVQRDGLKTFAKFFFLMVKGGVTLGPDGTSWDISAGQPWAVYEGD